MQNPNYTYTGADISQFETVYDKDVNKDCVDDLIRFRMMMVPVSRFGTFTPELRHRYASLLTQSASDINAAPQSMRPPQQTDDNIY